MKIYNLHNVAATSVYSKMARSSRASPSLWYAIVKSLQVWARGEGNSFIKLDLTLSECHREIVHRMCAELKLESKSRDRGHQRIMKAWRMGVKDGRKTKWRLGNASHISS